VRAERWWTERVSLWKRERNAGQREGEKGGQWKSSGNERRDKS